MRRTALILLTNLLLWGCATEQVLPRYPGSTVLRGQQSMGKSEIDGATVHLATFETYDQIEKVGQFYNQELSGFKGEYKKGQELVIYKDGNFKVDRTLDSGKPVDPKQPGHAVILAKGEGKVTIIWLWSVPKSEG